MTVNTHSKSEFRRQSPHRVHLFLDNPRVSLPAQLRWGTFVSLAKLCKGLVAEVSPVLTPTPAWGACMLADRLQAMWSTWRSRRNDRLTRTKVFKSTLGGFRVCL